MKWVDLNSDVGESYGVYRIGEDERLMPFISSANIACGFHAGDPMTIQKTVRLCVEHSVLIGAHVGYDDLLGFGRREQHLSLEEVESLVAYQVGVMMGFCQLNGTFLNHVKLHGALYNQSAKDPVLALKILESIKKIDKQLIFYGMPQSEHEKMAKQVGVPFCAEVFSDRNYQSDGSLVPRSSAQAIVEDSQKAIERMVHLVKNGEVEAISGQKLALRADTICIHGDTPGAWIYAKTLKEALLDQGIKVIGYKRGF